MDEQHWSTEVRRTEHVGNSTVVSKYVGKEKCPEVSMEILCLWCNVRWMGVKHRVQEHGVLPYVDLE